MKTPEQRRKEYLGYTALTAALIGFISITGIGAKVKEASDEAAANKLSSQTQPERKVRANGADCEVVSFWVDGVQKYVTVPTWDHDRIQDEVNRGEFASIENLDQCNERGEILMPTDTAAPQAQVQEQPAVDTESVRKQLDAKQVGDRFYVVLKLNAWNTKEVLVEKTANNRYTQVNDDGSLSHLIAPLRQIIGVK